MHWLSVELQITRCSGFEQCKDALAYFSMLSFEVQDPELLVEKTSSNHLNKFAMPANRFPVYHVVQVRRTHLTAG